MVGLDDFKSLVHHRRGVDGDLGAHAPVGVLQRLRGRHRGEEVPFLAPERPSGGREDDPPDRFGVPAPQALKHGVVLRIHGQDDGPGFRAGLAEHVSGEHERFLVGEADDLARQRGRQRPGQARRAHLRRKHGVRFGQGRQTGIAFAAHQDLGGVARGQQLAQARCRSLVQHGQIRGTELLRLLGQGLDVARAGKAQHHAFTPPRTDGRQCVAADGTGGAQKDKLAHAAPPRLGRRFRNIPNRRAVQPGPQI